MEMRGRALSAAFGLAGLVGCSLVAPLDGLSGAVLTMEAGTAPTDSPGAAEASPDVSEGGHPDTSMVGSWDAGGADGHDDADGAATDGSDDPSAPDGAPRGPADPCGTALFCDDFENGLEAGLWQAENVTAGSVGIDTGQAHSGTHALHAHTNQGDGSATPGALAEHQSLLPAHYFIRVFVYSASPVPPLSRNLVVTLQLQAPFWGMSLGTNYNGVLAITSWTDTGSSYQPSSMSPPVDQWVCLEWETSTTGNVGSTHVWMQGISVGDLTLSNLAASAYTSTDFGVSFYQQPAAPPSDTWFDDVVIATSYIPCSP
jgi:hypothetical protein